jgi:hypothetical protein
MQNRPFKPHFSRSAALFECMRVLKNTNGAALDDSSLKKLYILGAFLN